MNIAVTHTPALLETYAQFPLEIVSGCGARLRDRTGREYWDFYGGHAVALLGHSHPAVTQAIGEQAAALTFYSNVLSLDVRTRAGERLSRFAPPGLGRVFLCNTGAEANENALKLALRLTGRTRLAGLVGGWHGRSLLCLAVTDDKKITEPFQSMLCDTIRLRPNEIDDVAMIDRSIAAVILEPIQSIAGIVEIKGEFLQALRRRCEETGTFLIYDEIQTGMGRLGRPLVSGDFGVTPDMATLAKGIANGIPVAAVLMSDAIAANVKSGDLGTTFGGGPTACAAMLAVLNEIETGDLISSARRLGEAMHGLLRVGPVEAVLGRGCLIGLRFSRDAAPIQRELMNRGFVTGTSANPRVLRLMPPINMPLEAVEELAAALSEMGASAGSHHPPHCSQSSGTPTSPKREN